MDLPFKEAEDFGRQVLTDGTLEELRGWYTISRSRLANMLSTNTTSLKKWMEEPHTVGKIHSTTAARVGEFAYQLQVKAVTLYNDEGVQVTDLYPVSLLAGEVGRSTSSPAFRLLCRERRITCYDTGRLGIYIPKIEAEMLKSKEFTW